MRTLRHRGTTGLAPAGPAPRPPAASSLLPPSLGVSQLSRHPPFPGVRGSSEPRGPEGWRRSPGLIDSELRARTFWAAAHLCQAGAGGGPVPRFDGERARDARPLGHFSKAHPGEQTLQLPGAVLTSRVPEVLWVRKGQASPATWPEGPPWAKHSLLGLWPPGDPRSPPPLLPGKVVRNWDYCLLCC